MITHIIAKTVLFSSERRILALRRGETAPRRPLEWDLPGGFVDVGESFIAAASRELQEESGILFAAKDLQLLYTKTAILNDKNVIWLFFSGFINTVPEVRLSYEHSEHEWFTLEEAIQAFQYEIQRELFCYIKDNDLAPRS